MNNLKNVMTLALVAVAMTMTMGSCNQEKKVDAKSASTGLQIRYIDQDSVLRNYNLAKDFDEMATRLQNEYDQASKKHMEQLMTFAQNATNSLQQKQVTQDDVTQVQLPDGSGTIMLKSDAQKYEQMGQNAQNELGKLQQNTANQVQQGQQQLNDSIENFLKDYAKQNKFDMVLLKAATGYIDPKFEVTDEVIKGLNKRYTKVANK